MTDRCIIYCLFFYFHSKSFPSMFFFLTLSRVLVLGVAIEAEIPRSSLYPPPQRCSQTTWETKSLQHFLRLPGGFLPLGYGWNTSASNIPRTSLRNWGLVCQGLHHLTYSAPHTYGLSRRWWVHGSAASCVYKGLRPGHEERAVFFIAVFWGGGPGLAPPGPVYLGKSYQGKRLVRHSCGCNSSAQ